MERRGRWGVGERLFEAGVDADGIRAGIWGGEEFW
jgi:hypothetical protein